MNIFKEEDLKKLKVPESDWDIYLSYKKIPIDLIVPNSWNYKKESNSTSKRLRNNLEKNGQVENIQVRELDNGKYEVINGMHRYEELKKLNADTIVCYDHGKIELADAKKIGIGTNEIRFYSVESKLHDLISGLMEHTDKDELMKTIDLLNMDDAVSVDDISKVNEVSENSKETVEIIFGDIEVEVPISSYLNMKKELMKEASYSEKEAILILNQRLGLV